MPQTVSFGTLVDPEQLAIQRQYQLAQALRDQSAEPIQAATSGGMPTPISPVQGLAKLLQAYSSKKMNERADQQQQSFVDRVRGQGAQEIQAIVSALRGAPATPEQPEQTGNNPSAYVPAQAAQAAQPPDINRALAVALRSENPMVQSMGTNILQPAVNRQLEMDQVTRVLGGGQPGTAPQQGGAPAQGAGGGIGIPGVDPRAAQLAMLGGNAGKLGEMIQTAQKPIALREGDLVRPNSQGGYESVYTQPKLEAGMQPTRDSTGRVTGAQQIPGYAPGAADIHGQRSMAQAGSEMVTVDTPAGPRMMTRAQAAQLAGGGANGGAGGGRSPNPMAPQPGDSDRAAIYNGELQKAQQRLASARTPEEQSRAQSDLDGLRREMQYYRIPVQQQQGPGIALQDETSKRFGTAVGEKSAESLLSGRDQAKGAADDILAVQESRRAIAGGAFQGTGADLKLTLTKAVNSFVPGVTIAPEQAANTDYLKSVLGNGLLAKAKTLGSNPSNEDAKRINEIVGSIGKDPNAMNRILDWREAMARRAIQLHNANVEDAERNGMRSPYNLRIHTPAGNQSGATGFRIIGVK